MEKKILDPTCGSRQIWFQKQEPHTVYCDIRREEHEGDFGRAFIRHRHLIIDPDVQCDFTDLPFPDESFYLKQPHIRRAMGCH